MMAKPIILSLCCLLPLLQSCGHDSAGQSSEINQSDCEDPDADVSCCFINAPEELNGVMKIAGSREPGEQMIISGVLFKADGTTPYPDVLLYAYHTDATGHYSKKGNETGVQKWHGRLHGWCKTDANGYYEIHTIRPARYPGDQIPAHIHAAIRESDGNTYWINDFVFADDSLITEKYISTLDQFSGNGIVTLQKYPEGIFIGSRDIVLKGK